MKMQNQFNENVKKQNAIGNVRIVKNADLEQLNAKVKKKCKSLNNNARKWDNFALHNSCAPDIIEITL